jgi:hypothetical protein
MLGYKDYKSRFHEEMGRRPKPDDTARRIDASIDSVLDTWLRDLKQALISGTGVKSAPGLWGKIKNVFSNIYHGEDNPTNPYLMRNKFGRLGEHSLSLEEFRELHVACSEIEGVFSEAEDYDKLKIFQIISGKVNELKSRLKDTTKRLLARIQQAPQPEASPKPQKKYRMPALSSFPSRPETSPAPSSDKAADEPQAAAEPSPETTEPEKSLEGQPTTGKKFLALSSEEKQSWNKHGGGDDPQMRFLGHPLPLILRIGDPRREEMSADVLQKLKTDGRLEDESDPIANAEDLEDMIKAAEVRSSRSSAETRASGERQPEQPESREERDDPNRRAPQPDLLMGDGGDERFDAEELEYEHRDDASKVVDLVMDWPDEQEKEELISTMGDPITSDRARRTMAKMKRMLRSKKESLDMEDEQSREVADLIDSAKDIEQLMSAVFELEDLGSRSS